VGLAKEFTTTRDLAVGEQSLSRREVGNDDAVGMPAAVVADIAAIAGALPFRFSPDLMFDEHLASEPPPVPAHLLHRWLAPGFSRRVLLWCRARGWRKFPA
jgi:hypothetical protein